MNPTVDPAQQFFSMFAQANAAVWPMQAVWYVAAAATVVLAVKRVRHSGRIIAGMLAAYYAWLGIVFFGVDYSTTNDHAVAAGGMFVLGGALFLIAGVARQDLEFLPRWDLLAQTPAEALQIGVFADLLRPVVGIVAGALLLWRDYRGVRERLVGGAVLLVAVVCIGQDVLLMALASIVLIATFVRWSRSSHTPLSGHTSSARQQAAAENS